MAYVALILIVIVGRWSYVGLFDRARLKEVAPSLFSLIGEMLPPNFSEARSWLKPLADTLAMSVVGTAVAVILSL